VLEALEGAVIHWDDVLEEVAAGKFAAAFVAGGYPHSWLGEADAARFQGLKFLAVMDLFPSPLSANAHAVLPSAGYAERSGSYVNHAGLAQQFQSAVRPPADARPDGRILMELSGRRGLYNAGALRKEMAVGIPALAALAAGDLGALGVKLAAPALAEAAP
jgi:NADH-quinone oxidoreductase subunit G